MVKIYAWPTFSRPEELFVSRLEYGVGVTFENIESGYASALEACLVEAEQH
jgi:hypothetical protein